MNYAALYTAYIDRALLSIKLSSHSDDIWPDYLGIDDGDLERTMWSMEVAVIIAETDLNQLPLSIFCYEVLECELKDYICDQIRNNSQLTHENIVSFIQQRVSDMQDLLKPKKAV